MPYDKRLLLFLFSILSTCLVLALLFQLGLLQPRR